MAVKQEASDMSATKRHWLVGTNVIVMVLLATILLVVVNVLGYYASESKSIRWDLATGFGGNRLSDRTQRIIKEAPADIRISTVYVSENDPETKRGKFFPKIRDLCQEIREYGRSIGKNVAIEHVLSPEEQKELRDRIQEKFSSTSGQHREAVELARQVWSELSETLSPLHGTVGALLKEDSWLAGFSTLANIATVLNKDIKNIEQTQEEVQDLITGEVIPRYQEANTKIKSANDELKRHLEQVQGWTREMDKLVKALTNPEDPLVKTTREKMQEMLALSASLKQIAGNPGDANVPADPKPLLQDFAKAAMKLSTWLAEESGRIASEASKYPALRQHPRWQIQRSIFVMELPGLLGSTAENLGNNARELRRFLQQDVPPDQLQGLVRQLREIATQVDRELGQFADSMLGIINDASRIDDRTKEFLAKGTEGDLFSKPLGRLNEVAEKIDKLPELGLDEVAQRLKAANITVVEVGDKVKVVTFDDTYPISDPMGMMGRSPEEGGPPRVFDGDSAIGNAILAMSSDKQVGEVVLVTFETEIPPQMRQFQRPMTGPMPLEAIRFLRTKLEAMQFKVTEWNLAAEGGQTPPEAIEGVSRVYLFLPPPQPPSPMFGQQEQQPQFGPEHVEAARKVLTDGVRAVFLGMWFGPSRFGPPPEYGWGALLRDDWGVNVDVEHRVIRAVVDRKQPGRYGIDVVQWWYMQLSHFTDHPIGLPLRARRMLMKDVCPVLKADTVPEKVKIEPILEIPAGVTDTWAEKDLERIFRALQTESRDSSFTRGPDALDPPFSVVVAAENEENKGKVVVMGNGLSFRDDYMEQRVVRFGGEGTRLETDPPPTENLDLMVNSLYWLVDRPELIAAGPAEVPRVGLISDTSRTVLWLATMGWAAAALVLGGIVMVVRRK